MNGDALKYIFISLSDYQAWKTCGGADVKLNEFFSFALQLVTFTL
jgi:hypothetical protein